MLVDSGGRIVLDGAADGAGLALEDGGAVCSAGASIPSGFAAPTAPGTCSGVPVAVARPAAPCFGAVLGIAASGPEDPPGAGAW